MLAISTACLAKHDQPLQETLPQLVGRGFRAFELNHVVHPLNLSHLLTLRDTLGLTYSSLHNVCSDLQEPLEPDDRYGDNLASLDEVERRQSAGHLRGTALAARRLGAVAVVIHAGSVPEGKGDVDYHNLLRTFRRGQIETDVVQAEMRRRFLARKEQGRPHIIQLVRSLGEVCPEFPDLRFGIECRYHYYGLPDIDELEGILKSLDLPHVGYWHDCGHAQVQENLGLCRHEDWLQRYGARLVGTHLHGMANLLHDHTAPAPGNMSFEMIAGYLRPDTVRVMELSEHNTWDDIVAGYAYLAPLLSEAHVSPTSSPTSVY